MVSQMVSRLTRAAFVGLAAFSALGIAGCSTTGTEPTQTPGTPAPSQLTAPPSTPEKTTPSPTDPLSLPGGCELLIGETVDVYFPELSALVETRENDTSLQCVYSSPDTDQSLFIAWISDPEADLRDFIDAHQDAGLAPTPGLGDAAFFNVCPDCLPEFTPEMVVRVDDFRLNIVTALTDDPGVFSEVGQAILEHAGYGS
jgi:hypothetical protein